MYDLKTPAKVNLFFELLGKRPDGYHDVCTLTAPVDFYDTIRAEAIDASDAGPDGISLSCDCHAITGLQPDPMDVPNDGRNLVYKAAKLIRDTYQIKQGIRIELVKNIPPQSGLGGGSGNAAGALLACTDVWGLTLSQEELISLGGKLGSDVPLFFINGASLGTGRGKIITPKTIEQTLPIIIIRPPTGISTPAVYKQCRVPAQPKPVEEIIKAMVNHDWQTFNKRIFNRLEEFASQLTPWVGKCRDAIFQAGASGGCLCGSGSCYFGIFDSAKLADQATIALKAQGWKLVVKANVLL